MDLPDANALRVSKEDLRSFVYESAIRVKMPADHASQLADLLIASDLRGIYSHGSRQIVRYVHEIRQGGINPHPTVTIERESANSLVMNGDHGLGYFPAYEGTIRTIEKARTHGMAAMVTRRHGHIGAAGIYSRMTIEHDLLTFVTSGVQLHLSPDRSVVRAAGGSPMSFSAPAMAEPPLVLDCGVTHDMQNDAPQFVPLIHAAPRAVLRAIGFGTICQSWGGLLAGLTIDPPPQSTPYRAANQGAMLFTFKISLFADVQTFKREMDQYARQVRQLRPIDPSHAASLPGWVEAQTESVNRRDGIPLGDAHRMDLEKLADELGMKTPW
ncbi:MAG: Ldh family oxidoreductase [Phycisphaerales bacterium]|nr:Ldh family oxidoreductase [Phycisphaerales bacterium]